MEIWCHLLEIMLCGVFFFTAHLEAMMPIVLCVILSEVVVDCVKHAFITKFNDISPDVYRKYRLILSKDMTISRSSKVSY